MNHLYEIATGKLLSSTALDVAFVAEGNAIKVSTKTGTWNTSTLDFDPLPETNVLPIMDFVRKFTDAELEDILEASLTNRKVRVFIKKLELMQAIDLLSPVTVSSINGLAALSLITSQRSAEILA